MDGSGAFLFLFVWLFMRFLLIHVYSRVKQWESFSSWSPETEMLMDRQRDIKQTNEQTELHQFRKEPSYDGDLSPCQV